MAFPVNKESPFLKSMTSFMTSGHTATRLVHVCGSVKSDPLPLECNWVISQRLEQITTDKHILVSEKGTEAFACWCQRAFLEEVVHMGWCTTGERYSAQMFHLQTGSDVMPQDNRGHVAPWRNVNKHINQPEL